MNNHSDFYRAVGASVSEYNLALKLLNDHQSARYVEGSVVHINKSWLYLAQSMLVLEGRLDTDGLDGKFHKDLRGLLIPSEGIRDNAECVPFSKTGKLNDQKFTQSLFRYDDEGHHGAFSLMRNSSQPNTFSPASLNLFLLANIRNNVEHRITINSNRSLQAVLPFLIANAVNYSEVLMSVLRASRHNSPFAIKALCEILPHRDYQEKLAMQDSCAQCKDKDTICAQCHEKYCLFYVNSFKSSVRFPYHLDTILSGNNASKEQDLLNELRRDQPDVVACIEEAYVRAEHIPQEDAERGVFKYSPTYLSLHGTRDYALIPTGDIQNVFDKYCYIAKDLVEAIERTEGMPKKIRNLHLTQYDISLWVNEIVGDIGGGKILKVKTKDGDKTITSPDQLFIEVVHQKQKKRKLYSELCMHYLIAEARNSHSQIIEKKQRWDEMKRRKVQR